MLFSPFFNDLSSLQDKNLDSESAASFVSNSDDDASTGSSESQYTDSCSVTIINDEDFVGNDLRDLPLRFLTHALGSEEAAREYKYGPNSADCSYGDLYDECPREEYCSAEVTDDDASTGSSESQYTDSCSVTIINDEDFVGNDLKDLPLRFLTHALGSEEAAREYKYGPRRAARSASAEEKAYRNIREIYPYFDDWQKEPDSVIIEKYGKEPEEVRQWRVNCKILLKKFQEIHEWTLDMELQIEELKEDIKGLCSDYAWLRENY